MALALACASITGRSSAQVDERDEPGARSARLEQIFTVLAKEEHTHRLFRDGAMLAVGVAATAGGIVLAHEVSDASPYVLAGVGVLRMLGAGYDLIWGGGAYEGLAQSIASMHRAQLPEPEILRRIDTSWSAAAERSRAARIRSGAVESAIGGLLAGAGVFIALDRDAFGMDARERTVRAQAFIGLGSLLTTFGIAHILLRDPVEIGYELFRTRRDGDGDVRQKVGTLSIAVSGSGVATLIRF